LVLACNENSSSTNRRTAGIPSVLRVGINLALTSVVKRVATLLVGPIEISLERRLGNNLFYIYVLQLHARGSGSACSARPKRQNCVFAEF